MQLNKQEPKVLLRQGIERAVEWLHHEMSKPDSCFLQDPRQGFSRGIEFYSGLDLYRIAGQSLATYAHTCNRWPDMINPQRYTEKLIWMKFFSWLPVPSAASKTHVRTLLPEKFKDKILLPNIMWRSDRPAMPPLANIKPGRHYLKVSNSTATNMALDFPVSGKNVEIVKRWMQMMFQPPQVVSGGEWWYATIKPEVFVEETIGVDDPFTEWKFHVYNGKCAFLYERVATDNVSDAITLYDRSLKHLPIQLKSVPVGDVRKKLAEFKMMLEAAEVMAADYPFARVDFYRTQSGKVYLGEITLCPANAKTYFSDDEFDARVGATFNPAYQYAS